MGFPNCSEHVRGHVGGWANTINLYCPEQDLHADINFRTREFSSLDVLVVDRALRMEILWFTVAAFA